MNSKAKYAGINFVAGCLLWLVLYQALNSGLPEPWAPGPIYLIILLWSGIPGLIVLSLGTIAMWSWNPAVFWGKLEVPKRSYILFGVLALLSAWQNIISWPDGKRYQGETHTIIVTIINLLLITTLIGLGIKAWHKPTLAKNMAFHWLLFAWLVSYAFPYLGEVL